MMDGDLLEWGAAYARRSDPETSHDAADDLRGKKANHLEQIVLGAIREAGERGLTNHEIVAKTGLTWNCCSPRTRPLCRKGFIIDSGERRPGPTGKMCAVWKVV